MIPKISIIIPVFNAADYIVACLESVVQQSISNIEILLIDDCGIDDSIKLAAQYLDSVNHPYRLIKHEKNQGVSAARNTGINEACGDYVFFLDADDKLTEDCLEKLSEPLENSQYDIIVGRYITMGSNQRYDISQSDISLNDNKEVLEHYCKGEWHLMPWNKLCRKSFLIENELFFFVGQALHEDFIWSFESACKANSVYVVSAITYEYRTNPSSAMSTASIETDLAAYLPAFKEMIRFANQNKLTDSPAIYQMIEGKKNGILYSLLQKGETVLYNKYYPLFQENKYINPAKAFCKRIIGIAYFARDIDNALPAIIGRRYKRLFYTIVYSWRGKRIEGAAWE